MSFRRGINDRFTHLVNAGMIVGGSMATISRGDDAALPPLAMGSGWRGAPRGPVAVLDRDGKCTLVAMFQPVPASSATEKRQPECNPRRFG